jgi:hypothetical protein
LPAGLSELPRVQQQILHVRPEATVPGQAACASFVALRLTSGPARIAALPSRVAVQ